MKKPWRAPGGVFTVSEGILCRIILLNLGYLFVKFIFSFFSKFFLFMLSICVKNPLKFFKVESVKLFKDVNTELVFSTKSFGSNLLRYSSPNDFNLSKLLFTFSMNFWVCCVCFSNLSFWIVNSCSSIFCCTLKKRLFSSIILLLAAIIVFIRSCCKFSIISKSFGLDDP